MFSPVLIGVFVATLAIVLLIAVATGAFASETKKRTQRRLERVETNATMRATPSDPAMVVRRDASDSSIPGFDRLIKRFLPRPEELRQRLKRTGLRISAGEYVLASAVLALGVGMLMAKFMYASTALAVLVGLATGIGLPHAVVSKMIERRMKAFTTQFPEAIDLIVRGLKSGLPVPASMQTVSEELPEPVSGLFRLITDRLRIGQTLDDALRDAAELMPSAEFRFFVISLAVQRETGGNLAETLENLTDILRKRRQMKQKIKAMSSEAKASALILGSLPFLLFLALWVINPGYVGQLFTDPRGMMMVGFGLTSLGIGIAVMVKMVRFEI